ncbi:hypothetical protein LCGC14_0474220 [marine sediment metagenome]|uniref:Helicase A859L n=1 Tax=marine sediment metagenome TaxID=412755 RepID=A0A0F9SU25_9ZZZZ
MLYLIQCGGECGPLKIGWSKDPESRLCELQIANPYELKIIAVNVHVETADEFKLHLKFVKFHLRGEWFQFNPEIVEGFHAYTAKSQK